MKNRAFLHAAIVSGFLAVAAGAVTAQDWPQWRGANGDAKVEGFKAPKTWPSALTAKWKVAVGLGDSTPALVGDRLFVFSRVETEENVICLNAADGREIWRKKYEAPRVSGPAAPEHPGPRCSPAVAHGKVVTIGVTGTLTCWKAADGTQLWQKTGYKTWPMFYTSSSPLIVDGMCIAQFGGPSDGGVAAYDLESGDEKWRWTGAGPGYGSPVIMNVAGTKTLAVITDKSVVGIILADGKLAWQIPFTQRGVTDCAVSPSVDGDTLFYAGSGRGMHAVKVAKQDGAFTAKELWAETEVSPQFNTPVLKDGFLYGLSSRSTFFCVNARTGAVAWNEPDNKGQPTGYGSVLDAGSVLLALTPKSQLYVIQPGDKAYTELASVKVADSAAYAYPVISGNRIFIRDLDSVALLILDQP
jgi:outer membrane protein assembly factor BamB